MFCNCNLDVLGDRRHLLEDKSVDENALQNKLDVYLVEDKFEVIEDKFDVVVEDKFDEKIL